jgi:hypothetical protein
MALAALRKAYELASEAPPALRPVPVTAVSFPNLALPSAGNGSNAGEFRDTLIKIERRLAEDVDRWLAQMVDIHLAMAKSAREMFALSPVWPPLDRAPLDEIISQYDAGDKARKRVIQSLENEITRIPPDVGIRSAGEVEFFRASASRVIGLLEKERNARLQLRNFFSGLRDEAVRVRSPVEIVQGVNIEGYKALLMENARRCIQRIAEIAALPEGWHDGEGNKIGSPAIEIAYELVTKRPDLTGLFYIYPTTSGGIVFEFEFGGWDLSVEIASTGAIELYGVKTNDEEVLKPLSFFDLGPSLMKHINDRIGGGR